MQDLDEMELLMARAEEERRALESEVKHMRSTASEATSQLMLAEELAVRCPPICTAIRSCFVTFPYIDGRC